MNKLFATFISIILTCTGICQTASFQFSNGGSVFYKGSLFVFGITQPGIKILKLNDRLLPIDSFILGSKIRSEEYINLYADTIHDYLDIHLQQKEKKKVTTIRFDKNFKHLVTIEGIDIARLNNSALFNREALYHRHNVYDVRIIKDTAGKQFYLNRYELKSNTDNFEYSLKWQFPFERKNIRSARAVHADDRFVYLYVMVEGGNNEGEWLLKINAVTGLLNKATKLNNKTEKNTYFYGGHFFDKSVQTLLMAGQKFQNSDFDKKTNVVRSSAKNISIFLIETDSTGEKIMNEEFRIPIAETQSYQKKAPTLTIVQIAHMKKDSRGTILIEADIFNRENNGCFKYVNTIMINLIKTEEKYQVGKTSVSSHPLIEQYSLSTDKNDMNGKLCPDTAANFENIFKAMPPLHVKKLFKADENNNGFWVLTKSNARKNSINFTILAPEKKIYKLINSEDVSKSKDPNLTGISRDKCVLSYQDGGNYILKLISW